MSPDPLTVSSEIDWVVPHCKMQAPSKKAPVVAQGLEAPSMSAQFMYMSESSQLWYPTSQELETAEKTCEQQSICSDTLDTSVNDLSAGRVSDAQ